MRAATPTTPRTPGDDGCSDNDMDVIVWQPRPLCAAAAISAERTNSVVLPQSLAPKRQLRVSAPPFIAKGLQSVQPALQAAPTVTPAPQQQTPAKATAPDNTSTGALCKSLPAKEGVSGCKDGKVCVICGREDRKSSIDIIPGRYGEWLKTRTEHDCLRVCKPCKKAVRGSYHAEMLRVAADYDAPFEGRAEGDRTASHAELVARRIAGNAEAVQLFAERWRNFFVEETKPKFLPSKWSVTSQLTAPIPHVPKSVSAAPAPTSMTAPPQSKVTPAVCTMLVPMPTTSVVGASGSPMSGGSIACCLCGRLRHTVETTLVPAKYPSLPATAHEALAVCMACNLQLQTAVDVEAEHVARDLGISIEVKDGQQSIHWAAVAKLLRSQPELIPPFIQRWRQWFVTAFRPRTVPPHWHVHKPAAVIEASTATAATTSAPQQPQQPTTTPAPTPEVRSTLSASAVPFKASESEAIPAATPPVPSPLPVPAVAPQVVAPAAQPPSSPMMTNAHPIGMVRCCETSVPAPMYFGSLVLHTLPVTAITALIAGNGVLDLTRWANNHNNNTPNNATPKQNTSTPTTTGTLSGLLEAFNEGRGIGSRGSSWQQQQPSSATRGGDDLPSFMGLWDQTQSQMMEHFLY